MKILDDLGLTRDRVLAVCRRMGWEALPLGVTRRPQRTHQTLTERMVQQLGYVSTRRGRRAKAKAFQGVEGGD